MKRCFILFAVLAFLITLPACSQERAGQNASTHTQVQEENPGGNAASVQQSKGQNIRHESVLTGKIAKVEDRSILLMCEEKGLLSVSFHDAALYNLEGDTITAGQLRAGMQVEVIYNGIVMETYPGKPAGVLSLTVQSEEDDLVGFYADVVDDLYNVDSGLNEGVTTLAFDLTKVSNLTEVEKAALVYLLGCRYGMETATGTYEELYEAGYVDPETHSLQDGLLITIEVTEVTGDNTFTFSAEKWRSGDGAYFFSDCKATCQDGLWQYTVGAEMIS